MYQTRPSLYPNPGPCDGMWQVGAGLMGEQGAEFLHAHWHSLEWNYAGIPNKLDRLLICSFNTETYLQLLELRPDLTANCWLNTLGNIYALWVSWTC